LNAARNCGQWLFAVAFAATLTWFVRRPVVHPSTLGRRPVPQSPSSDPRSDRAAFELGFVLEAMASGQSQELSSILRETALADYAVLELTSEPLPPVVSPRHRMTPRAAQFCLLGSAAFLIQGSGASPPRPITSTLDVLQRKLTAPNEQAAIAGLRSRRLDAGGASRVLFDGATSEAYRHVRTSER
jgi:hypothetical protein